MSATTDYDALVERVRKEAAMLREIATSEARGIDWRVNLEAGAKAFDEAAAAIRHLSARDARLREALNERDLFINPDLLDQAADEIDCGPYCDCIYREDDVNFSMCVKSDQGEYCPNDVAETLRAVAKVAKALQENDRG